MTVFFKLCVERVSSEMGLRLRTSIYACTLVNAPLTATQEDTWISFRLEITGTRGTWVAGDSLYISTLFNCRGSL